MGQRRALGGRRRRVAQGVVLALIAGVLAVLAIRHEGAPVQDVELNDGGVWVTNNGDQMMARLNSQVKELEMGILTSGSSDEVFQSGPSVQVFDDGGGNIERAVRLVDPVSGTATPVALPETFVAAAGNGTVAITDTDDGRVWVRRADQLTAFTETTPADFEVPEQGAITVSASGTALVADAPAGTVTSYRLDTSGAPVAGETFDFDTEFVDDVELSAVGEVPVALQRGNLLRPGQEPVEIDGEHPVLQEVGPAADRVRVASEEGLWQVGLDGGEMSERTAVDAGGYAAAPVVVAGCVHAAWAVPGADNYQRQCGDDDPFVAQVRPLSTASELVFRTNREVVVLNDIVAGDSWLVEENGLTHVDNWPSVDPNATDPQVAEASEEKVSTKRNKPPQAQDDEFGARPGTTVVLPVTLNDVDPDGDILTLTQPPASTEQVTYSVAGGGTQVQARVAPDASGSVSFEYEVSDGHPANAKSQAEVRLAIVGPEVDEEPHRVEIADGKTMPNELTVAVGHEASVNVLPAWIDPEGDSLVLTAASSEDGEVGFRPDGTIDFLDDGDGPGRATIDFTVEGGEATTESEVEVTVQPVDDARPDVVGDRFSGPVGSAILLEPLANDTDPLGQQLTLPRLEIVENGPASLTKDAERGTATFRSDRTGTFFLEYEAASDNGQVSETASIRVDVTERGGNNQPPVATRDVAAVRSDGSVLVDVLANDVDPDGDVMVVQGVRIPPEWQEKVTASLINKRFVRVEVTGDLAGEQPEFEYLVSDGESDQVAGTVSVVRADNVENRRPVAVEDTVTVRAGTIVTIPVLDNDEDPDGDPLTVTQADLFDIDPHTDWVAEGEVPIVATGSGIRVMVPDDGTSQMQIGYGIRDPRGARAHAGLVLNIKADDPDDNRAPEPSPIEDRTVSGQRIRVPVDTFGADPDGDPVVYTGLVEPPDYGRIVRSGAAWFEYEPFESADSTGTDEFTITVTDPYGESATADVRIGVAARSEVNQAPAALDDTLQVKPGLTIQYPVMQNDSDPDGDPLVLEAEKLSAPEDVEAEVVGEFVEMEVPELGDRPDVSVGAIYSVTDELGSSSAALLTVTAHENAPDHAPLAGDDVVTTDQMAGKSAGESVEVDVLDNDGDLDGSRAALELEALAEGSEVVDRQLRVTLAEEGRVVPYKITDATEQSSFGFVYVAGTNQMPPQLNVAAVPVEVVAGEPESIALEDVVVVRDGHSPKVARTDEISSSNGSTDVEDLENLTFTARETYHGPASITLGVIDGEDLNDPEGLESQVTIPITVLPAGNVAPEVRSTSVVVYAGGEGRTIDLDRLSSDVNGDELSFEVSGERDGVAASVDGEVLTVSAADDAPSGVVDLDVHATDGTAEPQTGQVEVTVIGVSAEDEEQEEKPEPPMQLVEIRIADGVAGETERIDVTEAIAFDPYPGEPKQITWAGADGPAPSPTHTGSTLTVTPDGAGEVVVTYRLDDGSGETDRVIQGRVVIVVADVPDAPGAPTALEGGPDSVQLTWHDPDDNGSPIEHYLVRQKGQDDATTCVATRCLIEGLDPGETYQFTVSAVNGIDEGEQSPPSDPITPDTVPDTMTAPVIDQTDYDDRDRKLRLSWTEPANEGSDITHYEIVSSPRTVTKKPPWPETTLTWTELKNDTDYTFQIRAVNDRGPGVWSPWSSADSPFTRPSKMSPPTLVAAGNDNGDGEGYLEVSWPASGSPADGYDTVTSYDVQLYRDGAPSGGPKTVTDTTTDFTVANGHAYSATVAATNRAGTSEPSAQSDPVHTWDRATAVTGITNKSDCVKCLESPTAYRGRVSFESPNDNGGYPVTEYRWQTSDGLSGTWNANNAEQVEGATIIRELPFAAKYDLSNPKSLTITPYTFPPNAGRTVGAATSGGAFRPYAEPKIPSAADRSGYRKAGAAWTCDGNGRAVDQLVVAHTGAQSGKSFSLDCNTSASEAWTPILGADSRCLESHIVTTEGDKSATNKHGCFTADPPTVDVSFDPTSATGSCPSPCYAISVTVGGLLEEKNPYTITGRADGPCGGPFAGGAKSVRVGSGGRGTNPEAWLMTGKHCSGARVTVTLEVTYPTGTTRTFDSPTKTLP